MKALILLLTCLLTTMLSMAQITIQEVKIPGGEYDMGDHFNFVDPGHPSDETPIHKVKVNGISVGKFEITNQQYLAFLNAAYTAGTIEVRNNIVYAKGDTNILLYTNQYASYYSIGFNGSAFSITDFRANHPVVGVMWNGAAAFCNWLSVAKGYQACYTPGTGSCDFTKNGYRLPTEAEWEWAARGGHTNPYYNYVWGNDQDNTKANWPDSKDPYEGTTAATYPHTTPVGFYDGTLRQKTDFNWPGTAASYQTGNGSNSFGLFDMAGNVWEFVNDWYGQNYYSSSPYDNPTGPTSGFIMPDGKPYRGMRGGNWYNGYVLTTVNDGHSRVSNRNPSYYRGPQDPNHPWYHIGFRVARNDTATTGLLEGSLFTPDKIRLDIFPNPVRSQTEIRIISERTEDVDLSLFNAMGQRVAQLHSGTVQAGMQQWIWDAEPFAPGIYTCVLTTPHGCTSQKIIRLME